MPHKHRHFDLTAPVPHVLSFSSRPRKATTLGQTWEKADPTGEARAKYARQLDHAQAVIETGGDWSEADFDDSSFGRRLIELLTDLDEQPPTKRELAGLRNELRTARRDLGFIT